MNKITVTPIKAFNDNYIWCIRANNNCVVVDPGDPDVVLEYCKTHQLTLTAILVTHHHWDHTNGLEKLNQHYPHIPIYGPKNDSIEYLTSQVGNHDTIELNDINLSLKIMTVPGHTLDHIAYVGDIGLFCGDTLFSAGCGRLFEGTAKQMYQSLMTLAELPAETLVYCTHEYTLANLQFASEVEPNNDKLKQYTRWAREQRELGKPTLPTTIGQQKQINPFIRTANEMVLSKAEMRAGSKLNQPEDVFAALRSWKDQF